jgi:hypothetical protein
MGPALAYPMENKMSLVHHSIEQWGCSYTNKEDKGLIEGPNNMVAHDEVNGQCKL